MTATTTAIASTTAGAQAPASAQLRLPGQAAAPDGPVDLVMMFVMHHAFRRDLSAFADAAARTPVEDRKAWPALAERWELFSSVLHHHHSGEDAGLWPALLERVDAVGDVVGRATLEAMEAEHELIDPLLEACAAGFARLAAAADESARVELAEQLCAANDHLAAHLCHEETGALPIVQAHLTAADWHRIEKEHFRGGHSPRQVLRIVTWFLHGLPEDGIRALRRTAEGRLMIGVWSLLLRRGFERRERVAFAHLPGRR